MRPDVGAGYAALPVSVLAGLGAEVGTRGDEVEVRLGGRELRFRAGSAAFTVDGEEHRLAAPAYADGGVVFLPVQFFAEFLPSLRGSPVEVDAASRTLRRVRAPAGQPVAAAVPETPPPPPVRAAPEPVRRKKLVVVDAGHGGVDPGAAGAGGTREKTVTLAVARRLAAILREDTTLDVRMTRDRDTLIALRDRARMANRWREEGQPALFISIHCNANPSRAARGFETYFLAEAKTEDARRVAEMENAAQKYEKDASAELDPLSFILHDLRQNKYLRDSNDWAAIIQDELREVHPGPDRGVKQAGFAVLNGAFMPAVLVEIGFISNRGEEEVLADSGHQGRIAEQLASSIHAFFRRGSAASAEGGA